MSCLLSSTNSNVFLLCFNAASARNNKTGFLVKVILGVQRHLNIVFANKRIMFLMFLLSLLADLRGELAGQPLLSSRECQRKLMTNK